MTLGDTVRVRTAPPSSTSPTAEAPGLNPVQSRFESAVEYQIQTSSDSRSSVSAEVLISGLALLTVGNDGKGTQQCVSPSPCSVTPGKSGLPSSRYVGNSGKAMRVARVVSRERQRIVHVVRASQPSARVQRGGVSACSRRPGSPSSSRRANDTRQAAASRPPAFSAAVAQWQSAGLSIRKMSVQARSAAPHSKAFATCNIRRVATLNWSGGRMVKPRGLQPRNCRFAPRRIAPTDARSAPEGRA